MSSPARPTNVEMAPPVQDKAAPGEVPSQVPPTTAAPTKVDAYKSRGLRSKHSPLDLVPVLLRILTVVFTLIAFAVIASAVITSDSIISDYYGVFIVSTTYHFNYFFFFSYLLTVNVLAFWYALVTVFLSLFLLSRTSVSNSLLFGIFALDLILSYLLISASTSAATGMRIFKSQISGDIADNFISKASAAIAFSFLAFSVLAAAALFSGFRAVRRP